LEVDMRKFTTLALAAALIAPAALTSAPAEAHRGNHSHKYSEWQGKDGRTYCRKSNGTVGLIVGGAGGALLGRAVDTRGERATGTILGAAAGALIGREVASKRRCR
jgi:Glycine zipper 2TM domain